MIIVVILSITVPVSAGYRELFEKEFLSKPWSSEILEESACVECHTSEAMPVELRSIPQEWQLSWHYQNDVSCHDCHGGDSTDATMSMSHKRGFTGTPKYTEVPEQCGKCHIGILEHYVESGHGKALKETGDGPNCVTCHGAHNIQQVSIDIINAQRCSKCHSYDRAKMMKQALFLTDEKIEKIDEDLKQLRLKGVYPEKEEKRLFDTQAKFRTLFHSIDVARVKSETDFYTEQLDSIEADVQKTYDQLAFRRKFSTFLMLIFAGSWIVASYISKSYKD
jgi:nitrate/TMAO reductase-like tetraheme cytochrome c subunit